MNRLLHIITLAIVNGSSCKKWKHKYPEDPERTKDTPIKRLTGKWWILESATLHGVDYTDSVFQLYGKYQIYFNESLYETSINGNNSYYSEIHTDIEPQFTVIWGFSKTEENIQIIPLNGTNSNKISIVPGYLTHSNFYYFYYTILKLTSTEFKISISSTNSDSTVINTFKVN